MSGPQPYGPGSPPPYQLPPGYPPYQAGAMAPQPYQRHVRQVGLPPPVAVEMVAGTPYAVAVIGVAPTVSGPATASLVAGVGSILVSLVVGCFGLTGAEPGWGALVAGAFGVLAGLAGVAAVVLGAIGSRRVRRSRGAQRGRGLAVSGITCGLLGLLLTGTAMALSVVLTLGA